MTLTQVEEETKKTYDIIASEWSTRHTSRDFYKGEIEKLKHLLPEGKILEIGSGGGRDAHDLIKAGYEYIGTDVSKGLLNIAKKENPNAEFHELSVYDLNFPENYFDGFWASAVLLHIPKNRIDEALQKIHDVIRNGGVGFISLHEGTEEKVKNNEEGIRFFAYYQQDEFKEILERNNFEVLEMSKKSVEDSDKVFLYFFVKAKK